MDMDGKGHEMAVPSSVPIAAVTYDALFVVNGGESTVSVIDTQSNEVAATIELVDANFPHHLYLSADRRHMLLAVPGMDMSMGHTGGTHDMMGAVMLLDSTTGATVEARMTPMMNHNAIFSPDGSEVWTSQMAEPGAVLVLDAMTLDTLRTVEVGDHPAEVTFSASGTYGFVANGGSDSVTVIDTQSKAVVQTIDVGEDPVGAWQGDNDVAYVDNERAQTITAVDTNTLEVIRTYDLGFMPGMAALGTDDRLWVTDATGGGVAFFATDSDMKLGEVATGAGAHAIAFNGDGTKAYISNQMADTVSVIDVATSSVESTITVGSKPNGMVWRAE
jgi:YVTN family beta-propeller protein